MHSSRVRRLVLLAPLITPAIIALVILIGSPVGAPAGSLQIQQPAYATIQNAGVALPQRRVLNFPNSGCADNPGAARTDCTLPASLSGSSSINFASISDGTCAASTFTLTGALVGDAVAPAWPSTLETGLFGSMLVSAADTVQVRLCNLSGAAVDPAVQTFGAVIVR